MDKLRDPGEMVTPVPVATDSSGTPIEISEWLRELELEQYTSAFRENAIDSKILPTLTADDLH